MFRNSKKQGDAGLGQAIAYFTSIGVDIALPLTDSADWDMIVEIGGILQKVQVKTSTQMKGSTEIFNANVHGGNKTRNNASCKKISDQSWDYIFLYHLTTGKKALIPKTSLTTNGQINLGPKYAEYVIM